MSTGRGGHKGAKGKSQKNEMLRVRAQHIPCRGKIGQERERKQMRGPSGGQGGMPGIPGRGGLKAQRSKASGSGIEVWCGCALRFKAQGQVAGQEAGGRYSATLKRGTLSHGHEEWPPNQTLRNKCPFICQQRAT